MIQPEKSCYSGNYKAEKKHINKGVELEHLKFDSDTGEVSFHPVYPNGFEPKKMYSDELTPQVFKTIFSPMKPQYPEGISKVDDMVVILTEDEKQQQKQDNKTGNVTLWLIWIAILIGLCLATGAL